MLPVEQEVRLKYPKSGYQCDYKNSRNHAIRLFCLACMGESISTVSACKSYSCPLWKFRPGTGSKILPKGIIPDESKYQELMVAKSKGRTGEHLRKNKA